SYILADVPDVATAAEVCGIVRETPVGESRLWRYLRVEARLGRPLFFGTR
ncbi:iacB, partial [Streptomyces varsoviensis]